MPDRVRYERLKRYMETEFGVTPENIDEKLKIAKVEFYRRVGELEKLEKISVQRRGLMCGDKLQITQN